jgi:glucosamine-phosphate N-acetyltransferase
MKLLIRNCDVQDFEEIAKLLSQLWPGTNISTPQLKSVYQSAINSASQVYICAVDNSRIIGFCSLTIKNNLWVQGNLGHIDEFVIDEQYRGNGIGGQLLSRIVKIASENNCKRIELDSSFRRTKAHEFYMHRGFENRGYLFSKAL